MNPTPAIPGNAFQRIHRWLKTRRRRERLKRLVQPAPRRIVLGAANKRQPGWIPTDIRELNILNDEDWARYFAEDSISALLAEHVWEHLTPDQGRAAAALCFRYLQPGGYLRVAVPDGLHTDASYIERVRPGGTGPGAQDHKVLYTYQTFSDLFQAVGFEVNLLEYFDETGTFQCNDWSAADGQIDRSRRFDRRNQGAGLKYTSIILDAVRPMRIARSRSSIPGSAA